MVAQLSLDGNPTFLSLGAAVLQFYGIARLA
jgi:hypothetical protein